MPRYFSAADLVERIPVPPNVRRVNIVLLRGGNGESIYSQEMSTGDRQTENVTHGGKGGLMQGVLSIHPESTHLLVRAVAPMSPDGAPTYRLLPDDHFYFPGRAGTAFWVGLEIFLAGPGATVIYSELCAGGGGVARVQVRNTPDVGPVPDGWVRQHTIPGGHTTFRPEHAGRQGVGDPADLLTAGELKKSGNGEPDVKLTWGASGAGYTRGDAVETWPEPNLQALGGVSFFRALTFDGVAVLDGHTRTQSGEFEYEWVTVDPQGILEPYLDMIEDQVEFVLDLAGSLLVPVPAAPTTPVVPVEVVNVLSSEPNSVVMQGAPGGYRYYAVEVPAHATVATIMVAGAQGVGAWGGNGGVVVVENVPVTPGEVLQVAVGGQGQTSAVFTPYFGGGATWVQRDGDNSQPFDSRVIAIAGGGGGGSSTGRNGGGGGAGTGGKGVESDTGNNDGGDGGGPINDGQGLMSWEGENPVGRVNPAPHYAGGGGDGWRGGARGGLPPGELSAAGGGGGSSKVATGLTATRNDRGQNSGNGFAIITFPPDLPPSKPVNTFPPDGSAQPNLDGPTGVNFQWTYLDPNGVVDSQTGWEFRREVGPGVFEYWSEALGAFTPAPVSNDGAATAKRFPEGTWPKNIAHRWQVRVRDTASGNAPEGQWSLWSDPTVALEGTGAIDAGASNYLELALLDLVFNQTPYVPPAVFHVAAFVTQSNDDGGTEQSSLSRSTLVEWDAPSGGIVQNTNVVTLTVDPAATVVALGVFDAPVGGNMLVHVELDTPIEGGPSGQVYVFQPGDLAVQMR